MGEGSHRLVEGEMKGINVSVRRRLTQHYRWEKRLLLSQRLSHDPSHPMKSKPGGKNIRINNDAYSGHRLMLRLHRQQRGDQDKSSP